MLNYIRISEKYEGVKFSEFNPIWNMATFDREMQW
jgi:hypothetical protein